MAIILPIVPYFAVAAVAFIIIAICKYKAPENGKY